MVGIVWATRWASEEEDARAWRYACEPVPDVLVHIVIMVTAMQAAAVVLSAALTGSWQLALYMFMVASIPWGLPLAMWDRDWVFGGRKERYQEIEEEVAREEMRATHETTGGVTLAEDGGRGRLTMEVEV